MPAGIPSSCPKCGSGRVGKEYILGSQTGDWICGNCGETDQIERKPHPQLQHQREEPEKKEE